MKPERILGMNASSPILVGKKFHAASMGMALFFDTKTLGPIGGLYCSNMMCYMLKSIFCNRTEIVRMYLGRQIKIVSGIGACNQTDGFS